MLNRFLYVSLFINEPLMKMSAEQIQYVSALISAHPPIIIGTLCIFMYIRGRILHNEVKSSS